MWVPAATNNKTESHGQQQKDNEQTGNIHGTCLCIPVLFLTTVACCLVIFMWNSDFKMFEQKEFVKIKMNRIKDFQQEQAESQLPVDSCSVK